MPDTRIEKLEDIKSQWVACRGDFGLIDEARAAGIDGCDDELALFEAKYRGEWAEEGERRERRRMVYERMAIDRRAIELSMRDDGSGNGGMSAWGDVTAAVVQERALDRLTAQVKRIADLLERVIDQGEPIYVNSQTY